MAAADGWAAVSSLPARMSPNHSLTHASLDDGCACSKGGVVQSDPSQEKGGCPMGQHPAQMIDNKNWCAYRLFTYAFHRP